MGYKMTEKRKECPRGLHSCILHQSNFVWLSLSMNWREKVGTFIGSLVTAFLHCCPCSKSENKADLVDAIADVFEHIVPETSEASRTVSTERKGIATAQDDTALSISHKHFLTDEHAKERHHSPKKNRRRKQTKFFSP